MKRIYIAVFLASCSVLMFEVSLTRLFSVYLWYHFAFMVISIAMLGSGSAGTMLSLVRDDVTRGTRLFRSDAGIPLYSFLTGASIMTCYTLSNSIPFDPVTFSWDRAQFLYLALYCLILSVPFFFAGALIATAFLMHSERSASVYGSDLLGAGAGSLAVLLILDHTGAEKAVLTASTICLAGALLVAGRKIKMLSLAFILFNLLLFFVHPAFINVRISPYKELPLYLQYPGAEHLDTFHSSYSQIDTFKSPAIRSAPGLSLKYTGQLPEQTGLAIDGDNVDVITGTGDRACLEFLEFLPSSLPYMTGAKDDVLILDPKGGLHALMAEYSGSANIHKVESNPMVVKVVRDNFREFSGGIFDKDTWTGYGRSFLHGQLPADHGQRSYDIIDLSVTGASVSRAFGVSEDYRYTVEAFKKYLAALKEDGTLSISLYLIPPPRTEFRILATIIRAMEEIGVRDIENKLAAIRSWDSITILAGRSDLNEDKIRMIRSFAESRRFDPVYYPGITEEETNQYVRMPSNEYYKGFKELIDPQTRELFIRAYLFDISPVYDENPFFHYYFRLGNIERIYGVMGQKWIYFMQEGYLLPVILAIMLMLSIVLILLPVIFRHRHEQSVRSGHFSLFAFLYFAMLGLGFMFLEVSLIQKCLLLLENPSYAVAVVLASVLISSGLGSISSARFRLLGSPFILLLLPALMIVYSLLFPLLPDMLAPLGLKTRMAITATALMPAGFLMGIPFPKGMKLLGERSAAMIPWAWAVNASLSVIAPAAAVMIALAAGFSAVLWLGALAYLTAFMCLRKLS